MLAESGASSSKSSKVRTSASTKNTFHPFVFYLYLCPISNIRSYSHFIKRRKTSTKPRDASTPAASTTAESVRNLIKKNPRYSKRINYDALKDLFVDMGEDKKELYTMDRTPGPDPDLDMIGQEVIEEEGGAVGVQPLRKASRVGSRGRSVGERSAGEETDGVVDTDADEGSERGFVINTGWDDVYDIYEQEV